MASLREIAASFDFEINFDALQDLSKDLVGLEHDFDETNREADAGFDNTENSVKSLEGSVDSLKGGLSGLGSVAKNVGKAMLGISAGIAAVTAGAFLLVKNTSESIHALNDQANAANSSIESYQRLQFVTARAGVEQGAFVAGLEKVTETIAQASDPTSNMSKIYGDLGIATTDATGAARDSAEVLNDLRKAYQQDPTANAAKLQTLLGGSYVKNLNFLKQTDAEYSSLNKKVEENGLITEEQAAAAIAFDDSMEDLQMKLKSVGATLVQILGPAFTRAAELGQQLFGRVFELFGTFSGDKSVEDWADDLVVFVERAFEVFDQALTEMIGLFNEIRDVAGEVSEFIEENWGIIEPLLVGIAAAMAVSLIPAIYAYVTGLWAAVTAQAALIASNPLTWIVVGVALAVAAIYALWQNWDSVVAMMKNVLSGFFDFFSNIWDSIVQATSSAIELMKSPFVAYFNLLKTGFKGVADFFGKIFGSIVSRFNKLKSMLPSFLGGGEGDEGTPTAPGTGEAGGGGSVSTVDNTQINADTNVSAINVYTQNPQAAGQAIQSELRRNSGYGKALETYKQKRGRR